MANESLLAAVHAAAQPELFPAADAAPPQNKENPMSTPEKPAGASAEVKPTTIAELAAAFPQLVTQIRADAATTERERIAGIDKLAANRKGLDSLVAEMKSDAACTVEKAAVRILEAEGKKLEAAAANIRGVEEIAKTVNAAPSAGGEGAGKQQFPQNRDGWSAEYEATAALQKEFVTSADYVAFKANENKVRVLGRKSA